MTTLLPTRYAERSNSTFFEVADLLVTIDYRVVRRKSLLLMPGPPSARLLVTIAETQRLAHEYRMPKARRVGGEISRIERGLYAFLDEVVRSAVQMKALESAERAVEELESDHLYGAAELAPAERASGLSDDRFEQAPFVGELVDKLVTAFRLLTNVTSLTREGLEAYQGDRSAALEKVVESASLTSALRVQSLVQAVEAFLHHEVDATTDVKVLRERTLDYLAEVRRRSDVAAVISDEQAHVIVNDFVPAYLKLRKRYDAAAEAPHNLVEHALGSFFGGGIAGYLVISLFGEAVIRNLTGMYVDLPGWYLGAAVAFAWPYLKGAVGLLTRDKKLDREREALLKRINARLRLMWPEEN
ncbi:MAG: hypothetical protein JSU87_07760 [Gemmatimonadota bacterium]|nr:MAG: hypothetical protein JSU87_07760 [Gemmatimonadota bacterium]